MSVFSQARARLTTNEEIECKSSATLIAGRSASRVKSQLGTKHGANQRSCFSFRSSCPFLMFVPHARSSCSFLISFLMFVPHMSFLIFRAHYSDSHILATQLRVGVKNGMEIQCRYRTLSHCSTLLIALLLITINHELFVVRRNCSLALALSLPLSLPLALALARNASRRGPCCR